MQVGELRNVDGAWSGTTPMAKKQRHIRDPMAAVVGSGSPRARSWKP